MQPMQLVRCTLSLLCIELCSSLGFDPQMPWMRRFHPGATNFAGQMVLHPLLAEFGSINPQARASSAAFSSKSSSCRDIHPGAWHMIRDWLNMLIIDYVSPSIHRFLNGRYCFQMAMACETTPTGQFFASSWCLSPSKTNGALLAMDMPSGRPPVSGELIIPIQSTNIHQTYQYRSTWYSSCCHNCLCRSWSPKNPDPGPWPFWSRNVPRCGYLARPSCHSSAAARWATCLG